MTKSSPKSFSVREVFIDAVTRCLPLAFLHSEEPRWGGTLKREMAEQMERDVEQD